MRVGIMVPDLVANDAVGNDALGMYLSLLARGADVFLFTASGDARTPLELFSYVDVPLLLDSPDDALIYHHCIGDDNGIALMRTLRCSVIIKYHNVTPAAFTARYSAEYSRVSRVGREMLVSVSDLPVMAIMGDSRYNCSEFEGLVAEATPLLVVPPFHQIEHLIGMRPNAATVAQVASRWFNIVAVGRVVPNKGFVPMLKAFAAVVRELDLNVHLHIVGTRDPRLRAYLDELDQLVARHDLGASITWHGSVDGNTLATLYRHCDLFWTMSQHEGFCVPVVEAMAFSLPVLSSRKGALPETCGDAAAFADTTDECVGMLHRLVTDDAFRVALGRRGRRRYDEAFRLSRINDRFHAALQQIRQFIEERSDPASLPIEGDWFGLPDAENLIHDGLSASAPLHPVALNGLGRRLDFVDWIFREGWRKSQTLSRRLAQPDMRAYAESIDVPATAAQLHPSMRLRWQFSRVAHATFTLRSAESVSAFINWCRREQAGAYDFPMSGTREQPSGS